MSPVEIAEARVVVATYHGSSPNGQLLSRALDDASCYPVLFAAERCLRKHAEANVRIRKTEIEILKLDLVELGQLREVFDAVREETRNPTSVDGWKGWVSVETLEKILEKWEP